MITRDKSHVYALAHSITLALSPGDASSGPSRQVSLIYLYNGVMTNSRVVQTVVYTMVVPKADGVVVQ